MRSMIFRTIGPACSAVETLVALINGNDGSEDKQFSFPFS